MDTEKKWYLTKADGEKIEATVESWAWGVVYNDGTEFHQYDGNGVFHQIGEIKQEDVKLWVLYKVGPENKRIDIVLPKGAKLIHKYKRYVFNSAQLNGGDTSAEVKKTIHVFGYKLGKHSHFNFILPDDRIVQSTDEIPLVEFNP